METPKCPHCGEDINYHAPSHLTLSLFGGRFKRTIATRPGEPKPCLCTTVVKPKAPQPYRPPPSLNSRPYSTPASTYDAATTAAVVSIIGYSAGCG